jgi:hypothetical protein
MPLTLVLGPANSAKAGEVLSAYAAASRRDALLVVPTIADAAHYDRELAAGGATLGRALTFDGLLTEVARRAGYRAERLTPLQRERMLRRAIGRLELPALGDAARTPGLAAAAGALIAELGQARIGAPRFAAALRAWAGEDPERAAYAADVAALPLAYARAVQAAGREDPDALATRTLDALRAVPARWGTTPVFFYGFDDLTPVQRDAIETLAQLTDVTVSLTYERGRDALAARATVAEDLRAVAATVRELPSLDEHYAPASRAPLHHLERHLFAAGAPRADPGEAVVLMEAGGERAEAELVAAEILAARRAGVPPQEIVVVCRSLRRSGALFERTLRRFGIACASTRRVPLGHTALGRALLALGRCALLERAGADARDVVTVLRAPGRLESPAAADELERRIRTRGLTSAAQAIAASPVALPEIDALRDAGDVAAELARRARELLAAPHRRRAALLNAEERLDARALSAVLRALAELGELGEPLDGRELLELLQGLEVAAGDPPGPDTVLIAEPLAIRARRFRHVLITGLCEGEFPAPSGSDPFLGDDRRRELALASGLALAPPEDALARERYLFYACVSRATERLVLSYRSADEDGNLVLASPFLADVAELLDAGWRARRRRRLLADVVFTPSDAPTARERELALAAQRGGEAGGGGPATTRRLGETALRHVRHAEVLSGGALESFAACPVRWLVESQLQPRELAPDPEPLVKGSFMHDVLERVIGGLGGPLTPAALPEAERRLGELTAEVPDGLAPGRPDAVRRALLAGIEADLRRYLRHEASDGCTFVPEAVELRFGFDDGEEASLPPLVLDGDVRVRGVIDRIDVAPGTRQAIVRDYKSGSGRPERAGARWREERQMQVALYMLAARRLLALEPVAGFYQPLGGRDLRARGVYRAGTDVGRCAYGTDVLEPEALDELLAEVEAQAVELAGTLRRGELTPCPETCGRDGCRHPGICWAA